jgi:hypothetical protein
MDGTGMLISPAYGFIFFHGAKCAGTSVRAALAKYAEEPNRFKIDRPSKEYQGKVNPTYERWRISMLHTTAQTAKRELPAAIYNTYFKFGFVRNPWDWQVSMYHFILSEREHVRHSLVKTMAGFEEYLEWIIATKKPYPRGAAKFQKDMFVDAENNVIVDFIGRYETLTEDFLLICRRINIQETVPHLNRSTHRDYRAYYNQRTKQLVRQHFAADIETFGYTFE